jgi:hypothetical protein
MSKTSYIISHSALDKTTNFFGNLSEKIMCFFVESKGPGQQIDNNWNINDPFKLKLKNFLYLSDEQMDTVFDQASVLNSSFVENYFNEHNGIDWIVIAKKPGNIVASGSRTEEPQQDFLMKLAKKYRVPVFTYTRPKIIE